MHRDFWHNSPTKPKNKDETGQDMLLLMAVIYMLIKDGGDRELILALVYIMM